MVAVASLARYVNNKHEKKSRHQSSDKGFISYEQNGIQPVTKSLQNMLRQSTITVNV
jgi:hypothetical protein